MVLGDAVAQVTIVRTSRRIPSAPRVPGVCPQWVCDSEVRRSGLYPIEERSPRLGYFQSVESFARHRYLEGVVCLKVGVLSPVRIEEPLMIEVDKAPNQLRER